MKFILMFYNRWSLQQLQSARWSMESNQQSIFLWNNVWLRGQLERLVPSHLSGSERSDARHMCWSGQLWHSCPTLAERRTSNNGGWSGHSRCLWSLWQWLLLFSVQSHQSQSLSRLLCLWVCETSFLLFSILCR